METERSRTNLHLGSPFDDLLREDGLLVEVEARAQKRVVARQLEKLMKEGRVTKAELASRMGTSRSALDRLLDPENASVTLYTLISAARALGGQLELRVSASQRPRPVARTGRVSPRGATARGGRKVRV
ncbi:MAG: helix-turn-helix domain-containing protein [Alphaproteobacteria bacterium]